MATENKTKPKYSKSYSRNMIIIPFVIEMAEMQTCSKPVIGIPIHRQFILEYNFSFLHYT